MERVSFGGVEVLRCPFVDDARVGAGGEADDRAAVVADWHDEPVAEQVDRAPVSGPGRDAGSDHVLVAVTELAQVRAQRVPGRGRVPVLARSRQATTGQVLPRPRPLRLLLPPPPGLLRDRHRALAHRVGRCCGRHPLNPHVVATVRLGGDRDERVVDARGRLAALLDRVEVAGVGGRGRGGGGVGVDLGGLGDPVRQTGLGCGRFTQTGAESAGWPLGLLDRALVGGDRLSQRGGDIAVLGALDLEQACTQLGVGGSARTAAAAGSGSTWRTMWSRRSWTAGSSRRS